MDPEIWDYFKLRVKKPNSQLITGTIALMRNVAAFKTSAFPSIKANTTTDIK